MKTGRRRRAVPGAAAGLMLLGFALPHATLSAQDEAAAESPRIGCLRGRPQPACKSFWILEMQGQTPLVQTRRQINYGGGQPPELPAFDSELEWNLGHMVNLTPTFALGGVFSVGTGGAGPLAGVKARARR